MIYCFIMISEEERAVPTFFPHIRGNEENRAAVGRAVLNGTLSHAYIIEGADGCGKRTFAREIAAALACERRGQADVLPCGECNACRKILSGNSADVRYLAPTGATIGVDAIRELRQDMYLSSSEEERKVYIIDDAHTMTPQAQNALLIVLEEPPTDLLIFLLTDRSDALLPTIRSRTQTLRMRLLDRGQMQQALAQHPEATGWSEKSPVEQEVVLESAGGRLGVALTLLDRKKSEQLFRDRALTEQTINAMLHRTRYADVIPAMQALPAKRQELNGILGLLSTALRDLILLCRDPACPLCFYTDRAAAQALAQSAGITRLLRLSDRTDAASAALSDNANVQLTLLSLFTEI